jgi:uncharacterized protein YbjT (DUF2867 family)
VREQVKHRVFVTGATGYLGSRLAPVLLQRGHFVRALVRESSRQKVPAGCDVAIGDALRMESFVNAVNGMDTFVQLVGVAHPSPAKAKEFREIDLASVRASVAAAVEAGIGHFVYVSVAHPAPVMKEYIAVRMEGERLIREAGIAATILRPWYVLGPGHWWPYAALPFYWIAERIPKWRDGAQRLGLVNVRQMVSALARAVDDGPNGLRVWEPRQIRDMR